MKRPQLLLAMLLAAHVNGGTFAAFTFFAPIVTDAAGLPEEWVSVALMLFGVGSFLGVAVAGRLSDQRSDAVLAVGAPALIAGWITVACMSSDPVALLGLIFAQGLLSFLVGSTLITRVLYAAPSAPTMTGSYATAALNLGAAAGPALGAYGLTIWSGLLAPLWIAAILTTLALLILLFTASLNRRQ